MSDDEKSLLLFLETRAVDYDGRVKTAHMNKEDFEIAERWNKDGFVQFGRIRASDINNDGSHWVRLSDQAWISAHSLRQERGKRRWDKRRYQTTAEKQASQ